MTDILKRLIGTLPLIGLVNQSFKKTKNTQEDQIDNVGYNLSVL